MNHEECFQRERDISAQWAKACDEAQELRSQMEKLRTELNCLQMNFNSLLRAGMQCQEKRDHYKAALQRIALEIDESSGTKAVLIAVEAIAERSLT